MLLIWCSGPSRIIRLGGMPHGLSLCQYICTFDPFSRRLPALLECQALRSFARCPCVKVPRLLIAVLKRVTSSKDLRLGTTCHTQRSSDHYRLVLLHPSQDTYHTFEPIPAGRPLAIAHTKISQRHCGAMKFNLPGTVGQQHGRSTGKERKWKIFWTYFGDWVLTVFLWVRQPFHR